MNDFSNLWLDILDQTISRGENVAPRGRLTKELRQASIGVNMRRPVLMVPKRKLSYQFMAAEAYWILSGDDTVAGITPWNERIKQFSDDGERFFGAYGPKIVAQLPYVVAKLNEDPLSRQAGLTIWRENPPATRDYPCTITIFFGIRSGKLNVHVFMRSSDLWLGLPYDVFNFSMLGHYVCGLLNKVPDQVPADPGGDSFKYIEPGMLYVTAASSHIYQENIEAAIECLKSIPQPQHPTPNLLWLDDHACLEWLKATRDSKPGNIHRWWEVGHAS
jgi:thymidylate synthase